MRVLTDTHAMLWWLSDDPRLSETARGIIQDGSNELLWSIASSWEVAVKLSIGKLKLRRPIQRLFDDLVTEQGVFIFPVRQDHCEALAGLPFHHRDPFDRMLVAQAQVEKIPLLSADTKLASYDVEILW